MAQNKDNHTHPEEWVENDAFTGQDDTESDNLTDNETLEDDDFTALQQKYDKLNDSYLRLNAEFDNYRKRTIKEKVDLVKSGGERVLLDIISIVDDFDRAQTALHDTENRHTILEGMELIHQKFLSVLKQHGVTEIETIGQPFDPDRFEAITTVSVSDEAQRGTIIDCIQKGYELSEKIIRFPKVIVGE